MLRSDKLPGPRFNYSPCVKVGPIYQFAGLVGIRDDKLCDGGVKAETTQILQNLENALGDFGLSWEHLYSARLFTTRFSQFAEINEAWSVFFNEDNPPPARTAVGVSELPLGASVEIEFAFYKEDVIS